MWYVLLAAAAAGALLWGAGNALESRALRKKLARFHRAKGEHGRFVSQKKTELEKFLDNGGNWSENG